MKMEITSTNQITHVDGVQVRVWEGKTPKGIPVKVFVHRVAVSREEDTAELDRELKETMEPGRVFSLRQII